MAKGNDLLDDLFDDDEGETTTVGNSGGGDLLDSIPETNAEPWMPTAGDGIEGDVLDRYEVPDEMAASEGRQGEMVPCITLQPDQGEPVSVRGYRTVLRKEMNRWDPQRGDRFAVKYLGTDVMKRAPFAGKEVHIYKAACIKGGAHNRALVSNAQPAAATT